jgi:hypothetical protein
MEEKKGREKGGRHVKIQQKGAIDPLEADARLLLTPSRWYPSSEYCNLTRYTPYHIRALRAVAYRDWYTIRQTTHTDFSITTRKYHYLQTIDVIKNGKLIESTYFG